MVGVVRQPQYAPRNKLREMAQKVKPVGCIAVALRSLSLITERECKRIWNLSSYIEVPLPLCVPPNVISE